MSHHWEICEYKYQICWEHEWGLETAPQREILLKQYDIILQEE